MWADGADLNEDGKPVRLYQPILYSRRKQPPAADSTTAGAYSSFIGGVPSSSSSQEVVCCSSCNDPLHLLVQLENNTTEIHKKGAGGGAVQVFACNRASCIRGLFGSEDEDKLCYGGKGVVLCRRIKQSSKREDFPPANNIPNSPDPTPSDWVGDDTSDAKKDDENEWTIENTGDKSNDKEVDDLESKLAAMETKQAVVGKSVVPSKKVGDKAPTDKEQRTTGNESSSSGATSSFPCFELHSIQEPSSAIITVSGTALSHSTPLDDDDVGIVRSGGSKQQDDQKIQQMLQKYLAEEDDPLILAALQAGDGHSEFNNNNSSKSTGGGGERDERLSATDRALLTFSDRLKRSRRQVLRYAFGGMPLWSIPVISTEQQQQDAARRSKNKAKKKSAKGHQNREKSRMHGIEKAVPPCPSCGAQRVFEFQLLPSLLHVLEVDKYATASSQSSLPSFVTSNGMDWGNIAVYSCPNAACDVDKEEFCVIQDSVDAMPVSVATSSQAIQQTRQAMGDVVIEEDAKFDDDSEEEDDDEYLDDEDDEEEGLW